MERPLVEAAAWLSALLAGLLAWLWLLARRKRATSHTLSQAEAQPPRDERSLAKGEIVLDDDAFGEAVPSEPVPDEDVDQTSERAAKVVPEFSPGSRVQFCGLQKAQDLNGRYGIVLRLEKNSGRYAIRKEVAGPDESLNVTVKASNLCSAPPHSDLKSLQQLIDAAPPEAHVTFHRGEVLSAESSSESSSPPVLEIKSAITLGGVGSKSGGTVLNASIFISDDVRGESIEICDIHVNGAIEISPRDLRRVRLCKVAITAPLSDPALIIDEICSNVPKEAEAMGRVLLDQCWVRGGSVGVLVNAVGCVFRKCRIQGASTYGIRSNANFSIEGCTIGECGKSGRGGGIISRGQCHLLRNVNGWDENRVQRDATDKRYSGYLPNCRGCVGQCTCTALMALGGLPVIQWADQGQGKWLHLLEM